MQRIDRDAEIPRGNSIQDAIQHRLHFLLTSHRDHDPTMAPPSTPLPSSRRRFRWVQRLLHPRRSGLSNRSPDVDFERSPSPSQLPLPAIMDESSPEESPPSSSSDTTVMSSSAGSPSCPLAISRAPSPGALLSSLSIVPPETPPSMISSKKAVAFTAEVEWIAIRPELRSSPDESEASSSDSDTESEASSDNPLESSLQTGMTIDPPMSVSRPPTPASRSLAPSLASFENNSAPRWLSAPWREAIARYEADTGVDLRAESSVCLESDSALYQYLDERQAAFEAFRVSGAHRLRETLAPVVASFGPLCAILGEGFGVVFAPSKVVFSAVGRLCVAAVEVGDELEAISDAFDAMAHHLRILKPLADTHILQDDALKESSVRLLAQILIVLGVIQKVQQQGRLVLWLKKLTKSKEVSSALEDLSRLAGYNHENLTAVVLFTARKTMTILTESDAWNKEGQRVTQASLATITMTAQKIYAALRENLALALGQQNENRRLLENIQVVLLQQINEASIQKKTADLERLFAWLQYPDSSVKMNTLLDNRAQSTGIWFLDCGTFTAFKEKRAKALWVHGKAGCGKSTMIAAAIQDLRAEAASSYAPSTTLMHFFDTTGSSPRNLRALLSTLLCQLADHDEKCADQLFELRARASVGYAQIPLETMRHTLDDMLTSILSHIYVVVDALDEADDPAVILFLARLRQHVNLSLMVSSRYEVTFRADLEELCDATVAMTEDRVAGDIKTLLTALLNKGGSLSKVKETELVRSTLAAGAEGNFRWVLLQARELIEVAGIPTQVRRRLKMLPRSLEEIYDRLLYSIHPAARDDVRLLLSWVVLTVRPLSTADFAELLSFDYSGRMPSYDASLRPSADHVLALVGSTFLSIHDHEVQISHASVKDHLLALPSTSPFYVDKDRAYCLMARTGLAYVAHAVTPTGVGSSHLTWSWVIYMLKADILHRAELEMDADRVATTLEHPSAAFLGPLHTAAEIGYTSILRMLCSYGADPNLRSRRYTQDSDDPPLVRAATGGHPAAAQLLLDRGADVDGGIHSSRWTPLHIAAGYGHLEVADLLISRGADVRAPDEYGRTALYFAVQEGHITLTRLLIAHEADVNAREAHGWTPLHAAAARGRVELVQMVLDNGAVIEACDENGWTALHIAAQRGDVETTRLLLERGMNVDEGAAKHWTPLHMATRGGHIALVCLLLDHGADPRTCARGDEHANVTPLHIAAHNGHLELTRILLEQGVSPVVCDGDQRTPIHLAALSGAIDLVHLLIHNTTEEDYVHGALRHILFDLAASNGDPQVALLLIHQGAKIDGLDDERRTLLHVIVAHGHIEFAELLLDEGADLEARDERGRTALHLTARRGHLQLAQILLSRGADVEARDNDQWTALHFAAHGGSFELAELLIAHGADTASCEESSYTPHHIAMENGHLELARLIREDFAERSDDTEARPGAASAGRVDRD